MELGVFTEGYQVENGHAPDTIAHSVMKRFWSRSLIAHMCLTCGLMRKSIGRAITSATPRHLYAWLCDRKIISLATGENIELHIETL